MCISHIPYSKSYILWLCVLYAHYANCGAIVIFGALHSTDVVQKRNETRAKTIKWLIINAKWWQFAHEIGSFTSGYDVVTFTCTLLSFSLSLDITKSCMNVPFLLRFVDSAQTVFISISHLCKNSFCVLFECWMLLRIRSNFSLFPSKLGSYLIRRKTLRKNIIERAWSPCEKFHDTSHRLY